MVFFSFCRRVAVAARPRGRRVADYNKVAVGLAWKEKKNKIFPVYVTVIKLFIASLLMVTEEELNDYKESSCKKNICHTELEETNELIYS